MMYKKRIIKLPENSHTFLFGVRGSGKTALLNRRFPSPKSLHIDLLDESLYQSLLSDVAQFYETVSAFKEGGVIIVDEIQKMPRLLNEVHRLIEESSRGEAPPRQFILTGSSARKLKAPGVNLLAGRAGKTTLHPFVPEELGEDFNLNSALQYGLLPIVWSHHDREFKLKAYAEEYLKEEIQAMALVRNLPDFARFLEVAGLYHGQAVNMSAISRECQTPQKAVRDYFSILEDTLLGFFLPAYTPRLQLRERKHKKFYFIDPGLARTLRKDFGPVSHTEKGSLFEGLTAQILRAYRDYNSLFEEMFYWSPVDSQKTEVDFLLRKGEDLTAIEVKARSQISSSECKGLKAIQKLKAVKKRILVYMGSAVRRTEDGIDIWPFDFFCQNLKEGHFNVPVVGTKKSKKSPDPVLAVPSKILTPKELQIPPPADEKKFEELCLDLYRQEFGGSAQLHGRKGQKQHGVDIVIQHELANSIVNIGVQCKKREQKNGKITEKELLQEVEKAKNLKPALNKFILATTCQRDANIQKTAWQLTTEHKKDNLFSVEIHSWDEIKELLDKYLEIYQKYYGNVVLKTESNKQQSTDKVVPAFNAEIIKKIKNDSHHAELKMIHSLLNKKPKTALDLLEKFKQDLDKLNDKVKYKVLIYMADAKHRMKDEKTAFDLTIDALEFNNKDENALINCAFAYLMKGDLEKSKKYLEKTRALNPRKTEAYNLDIQIQFSEGKSIKEIVANLPEDIKNQAQIAQLLAGFSINQKDYKSAEKWAKIFYTKIDQKNLMELSTYADLMLKIITKDPNIYKTREITNHQYQSELKEIVSLYKKIFSESEYNEIREINANLYVNYAIALEMKGELDKAIDILKKGENLFPEDYNLKHLLIHGFLKKKAKNSKVMIQDQKPDLYHSQIFTLSKTEDCNDIVDIINKIPEEKRNAFAWSVLADIKFFNENSPNEGIEILQKTSRLKHFNIDDQFIIKEALIDKFIKMDQAEKADQELNDLCKLSPENPIIPVIKSKIYALKGDTEKQNQCLEKALEMVPDNPDNEWFLYFLAKELYNCKMYAECEPLFENLIENNLYNPDIFTLLHIYFENGQNQKAIKLAETLNKKFPHRLDPVNILFLIYEDLGDREKAIKYYEDFMKHNPQNELIKIELALAYIRNEQSDKAKALLNKPFNLNLLSINETGRLASVYSHTGQLKKALDILYQSIRKHPSNKDLQHLYSGLYLFGEKKEKIFLSPSEKVAIDCYLKIQEVKTAETTDFTIEKSADIYAPDHPFAQKFLGKIKGDTVQHEHKQYKILEIKNKYLHKLHEIMSNAEKRFPVDPFIKTAILPKLAEKEDIAQALKPMIPDTTQQREKVFQYYKQGRMTIGSMSRIIGLHPIEMIATLSNKSSEHKFISSFVGLKNYKTSQENLNKTMDIIMDISSLFTMHVIKMEKYFEESSFNLCICPSTIESIRNLIQKMKQHSQDGLLTGGWDKQGKLITSHTPPEIVQKNLHFLEHIIKWAKEVCAIKPVPVDYVMNRDKKSKLIPAIGKEFLDPLLFAHNKKNTVLLSEDGVLGALSKNKNELNVLRVRLWDIIHHFKNQSIINEKQAVHFTAELIKLNQVYIPVDHKLLLVLLKSANYSITDIDFQRGLYFMGPVSNLHGVIEVLSQFLKELFQEPALLLYQKEQITQEVLNKAYLGRRGIAPLDVASRIKQSVQAKTILLPFHQKAIENSIDYWLKNKIY